MNRIDTSKGLVQFTTFDGNTINADVESIFCHFNIDTVSFLFVSHRLSSGFSFFTTKAEDLLVDGVVYTLEELKDVLAEKFSKVKRRGSGAIIEVVDALPTQGENNTIYLIKKASKDGFYEYIYTNGKWEEIGDLDIDLDQYVRWDEIGDFYQTKLAAGDGITIENGVISSTGGFKKVGSGLVSILSQYYNDNIGRNAVIEGDGTEIKPSKASGNYSHSEGFSNASEGLYSHSEGINTIASEKASHSEGNGSQANGTYSHSEGNGTVAEGNNSHSEGYQTQALGEDSHSEGNSTMAVGDYSHTGGFSTQALNRYETAIGVYNVSNVEDGNLGHSGNTIFSIGIGNGNRNRKNALEVRQNGDIYIWINNKYEKLQDIIGYKEYNFKFKGINGDKESVINCGRSDVLTSIDINDEFREIIVGDCAYEVEAELFKDFKNLYTVTISDTTEILNERAFYNNSKLVTINLGSNITEIGDECFNNCPYLAEINIKAVNPPQIGNNVFNSSTWPINVPMESVEAYKEKWNQYASRIKGK